MTIRQRAVAAWPTAWQGQNRRDILVSLGYDVDRPWRELPKKTRDWILFADEQPVVPVYAGLDPPGGAAGAQTQRGTELPGHIYQRAALYAQYVCELGKRTDEAAGIAVHGEQ